MIIIEILGSQKDAAGNVQVRAAYYSDRALMTRASDSPANVTIHARLADLPSFKRRIGGDGGGNALIGGTIEPGFGNLNLLNPDGGLDGLLDARWLLDARVRVHSVAEPLPAPLILGDGTSLLFEARAGLPVFGEDRIELPLYAGALALDKPLLAQWDAASMTETVTDSTTAQAIRGQRLPRLYGVGGGMNPVLMDASRQIYLVSDRPAAITAAYDRGSKISGPADGMPVASLADLLGGAPAAGTYRYWAGLDEPGRCYIRLGSVAQQLTVWATAASAISLFNGGAQITPASSTIHTAVQAILADCGLDALYIGNPASWLGAFAVGWWGKADETPQDAIRYLLASVDGWFGLDRRGQYRIGKLEAPGSGAAPVAYTLPASLVRSVRCQWRNGGAECWRWTIKYARNWTPQEQVAVALDAATSARHRDAWCSLSVQGAAPQQPWEVENSLETALYDAQAAQWLGDALLARYRGQSRLYTVDLGLTDALLSALEVGQCVALVWPRFGLAAGRALIVLSVEVDLGASRITLELWG